MISIHPNAHKAAEAAEAAGAQGGFWAYHVALYEGQNQWAGQSPAGARDFFIKLAQEQGLDVARFTEEFDNDTYASHIDTFLQEATNLNLPGTPSVIYNGDLIPGDQVPFAFYVWDAVVQLELLKARQFASPPPMTIDTGKRYQARVQMESGDEFVIELYPASAPQTVNSFIFLANEGWFDGVTFHRVIPDFVAQTGDPTGTGVGGPGYTIPNEIDPNLTHADVGMVAMANSGADTNGSQWYITLADVSELDGSYTIFGKVIEGMAVVQALTPRDPSVQPDAPAGDRIKTIIIEEIN